METCPHCVDLQRRLDELHAQVERLAHANAQLQRQLDEARRAGKRQAAPFAKGPPKPHPKTPGRKAGDQHGRHGHRPPPAEPLHECHEADLPAGCPHCGAPVAETHVAEQFQVDLPRQPVRRRFRIHCGRCSRCGRPVRGRHPLQTSDATGAAASQVGPDAQAAVVLLNKQCGLSHAKVAGVLTTLFGIPLTRGASAQIVLRAGHRLAPAYQEIRQHLPGQDWLSVDETGWRVGGHPAWLHVWVGGQATAYAIDPQRHAGPLEQVIGLDWEGILVHDGWASYDRFECAAHQQCLAHVLRRAHELEEAATGRAAVFPRQLIDLLQASLQARDQFQAGRLDAVGLAQARQQCVGDLLALTARRRRNAANERLAKHLFGYAEQWFTFLEVPGTPATNWPAEQATRPAVVNRKVWGGNRTAAGAEAQAVTMSVLATCRQGAHSALDYVSRALRGIVTALFPKPVLVTGANQ
jgi:transposase